MHRNVAICYTDGSASPNPGPAGAGACIFLMDPDTLYDLTLSIGFTSNNIAEIVALDLCLYQLIELHQTRGGFCPLQSSIELDKGPF